MNIARRHARQVAALVILQLLLVALLLGLPPGTIVEWFGYGLVPLWCLGMAASVADAVTSRGRSAFSWIGLVYHVGVILMICVAGNTD